MSATVVSVRKAKNGVIVSTYFETTHKEVEYVYTDVQGAIEQVTAELTKLGGLK